MFYFKEQTNRNDLSPPLAKENVKNVPNKEDLHNKQADYPKWMRVTTCRRFPYFPQLGDLVVYFQQGHEAYLGELKKTGIPVSPRFKIKYNLLIILIFFPKFLVLIWTQKKSALWMLLILKQLANHLKRFMWLDCNCLVPRMANELGCRFKYGL